MLAGDLLCAAAFDFLTLIIRFNTKRNTGVKESTLITPRKIDDASERVASQHVNQEFGKWGWWLKRVLFCWAERRWQL
jgi:hypothetical protein